MSWRNFVKDCLPPVAVRIGGRLLRRALVPLQKNPVVPRFATTTYQIGSTKILLPGDHALPRYQSHWRLYDLPLRLVADAVREHFGALCAIDIGANVGDSAALMNGGGPTRILCIEGDPVYLPFLELNAKALGPHVIVETCFIGPADGSLAAEQLERRNGTTAIRDFDPPDREMVNGAPIRRLDSVLRDHPSFQSPQLLKIDTDGYDFSIILSHLDYIDEHRPVLYFEYLLESESDHAESLCCIRELLSRGYADYLVFDNFGNYLLRVNEVEAFEDLNAYLQSNRQFGRAVHYLDVCAVPQSHREIMGRVRGKVARLLEEGIGPTSDHSSEGDHGD